MNIGVTIATVIFVILVIGAFLVPGYMMQSRIAQVVGGRDLEGAEHVLAVLPGFNLAITRSVLYNSAVMPIVVNLILVITLIVNFVIQSFVPIAILELISLIITWIVIFVAWAVNGYIIQDAAACMGLGFVSRVLSFIAPPLVEYLVARYTAAVEED